GDVLAAGGAEDVLLAAVADYLPCEDAAARRDDLQPRNVRRRKAAGEHGLASAGVDRRAAVETVGRENLAAAAGDGVENAGPGGERAARQHEKTAAGDGVLLGDGIRQYCQHAAIED